MLKVLLRKQFLELKDTYFKSKKVGTSLTKKQVISKILLLVFVVFACCSAFYGLSILLYTSIVPTGVKWLYFALMAMMAIVIATIVNMFMTSAMLYSARDNDLLLSLPIKQKDIVLSRIVVLYVSALIYAALVYIPVILCYQIYDGFDINSLICSVIVMLVIGLIALALSCLCGFVVAFISKRFKNNRVVTVTIYLLFIGIYYYINFNLNKYIEMIVANIDKAQMYVSKIYLLYLIGEASTGDYLSLLISVLIALIIVAIIIIILIKTFYKIVTLNVAGKKEVFKDNYSKVRDVKTTLEKKELKRLTSNTTYLMNTCLGIVMLIALCVAAIIKRADIDFILESIETELPLLTNCVPIYIFAIMVFLLSMDAVAVPSVSLEGNTYWITRSLPINTYDILAAKKNIQIKLHIIPACLATVVLAYLLHLESDMILLITILTAVYEMFIANFHLFLGIMGANLNWTNEIVPIKQSSSVAIAVFSGMLIAVISVGAYLLLSKYLTLQAYVDILLIIFALASRFLDSWIRNKGVIRYENL